MKIRYLICCLALSACYLGEETPPDQTTWEYGRPKDFGLSEDSLLSINARLIANQNTQETFNFLTGLIIIKDRNLVFENYYLGTNRVAKQNIGQGGLTFVLSAIGVAEDKRQLSISDPIFNYLPEYIDIFEADTTKKAITIEHLLKHKGGLSWNESIFPVISPQSDLTLMRAENDWIRFVLEKPLEAPPGLRFNLNSASGLILSKIIENASGMDYLSFLDENILQPLDINSVEIETDPRGNYNSGNGLRVSLINWTKLGYLILNEGIMNGRKIIDPNFIKEATTLQTEVTSNYSVGYFWWLFAENFDNRLGVNPQEIYYIPGELGQHMYLLPSENAIISIFAENFFFGFNNPSLNLFEEITFSFQ
ncbi:MAG: serine hydrolase [Bacteroidota bacterium]